MRGRGSTAAESTWPKRNETTASGTTPATTSASQARSCGNAIHWWKMAPMPMPRVGITTQFGPQIAQREAKLVEHKLLIARIARA